MNKLLTTLMAACALVISFVSTAEAQNSFDTTQTQAIEKIVHDYLVNNPEVLVEASQALQQQQMEQQQQKAKQAITDNAKELINGGSPVAGNADGAVTLVEFLDFQCPHCKSMGPVIDQLISDNKDLRVVVKVLPIFGDTSVYAAKAAIAANKQGKYFEFHDNMLKSKGRLNENLILSIAKQSGLDVDQLKKDMDSDAVAKELAETQQLAQQLGIMGTPAFIVTSTSKPGTADNTAFIPGAAPADSLQSAIDRAQG